jgi:hypothetical protein
MLAVTQPTSPAAASAALCAWREHADRSTWWTRPVDITSSLSPALISPCITRTSDTTPR